jgi:regulatory protein
MPGIITAISPQKKRKDRVNIYIDEAYSFSLPLWAAGSLKKGAPISQARIDELKAIDENDKAFQRAISFLAVRPRSRKEIERHLHQKGISMQAIEQAINRLDSYNYINDAEFARIWIENRLRQRPRGRFGLSCELKQKGVSEAVIEAALSGYDEHQAAWAAIRPKLGRWENLTEMERRRKIYSFLKQRGFSGETIRDICEEVVSG